jgi:hypothetical protein
MPPGSSPSSAVAISTTAPTARWCNTTDNRVVYRHKLDSFDPPQYGLATQLESDPLAHTVLVSEDVSDDPDVSDVWTFNGSTLHHVRNYFGDALLAEP